MTAHCPTCGTAMPAPSATTIAELRALHAHRTGPYADAYRAGLTALETGTAPPLGQQTQGYRDGLALRPYRLAPPGRGSVARNVELQRIRRAKNKS